MYNDEKLALFWLGENTLPNEIKIMICKCLMADARIILLKAEAESPIRPRNVRLNEPMKWNVLTEAEPIKRCIFQMDDADLYSGLDKVRFDFPITVPQHVLEKETKKRKFLIEKRNKNKRH